MDSGHKTKKTGLYLKSLRLFLRILCIENELYKNVWIKWFGRGKNSVTLTFGKGKKNINNHLKCNYFPEIMFLNILGMFLKCSWIVLGFFFFKSL